MKKKKPSKTTLLLILVLLVGLSLMLYPPISDYWNSFRQSRAIATYMEKMSAIDKEKYQALLEEAKAYNASLPENPARFSPTDEELAYYLSLLGTKGTAVGYVEAEAIQLSLPIYLGTSETVLQVGAGTMEGTSIPIGGESTHAVLTGHRGLPSATLFTDLGKLVEGDIFHVHILNEVTTYEVDQILIVDPHDVSALAIEPGQDYCTLVTCTPYGVNTHRMLVRGRRVEAPEDMVFLQVSAEAAQIEPLLVAPLVAAPILLILLVWLLCGGGQVKETEPVELRPARGKKGGNPGDKDEA